MLSRNVNFIGENVVDTGNIFIYVQIYVRKDTSINSIFIKLLVHMTKKIEEQTKTKKLLQQKRQHWQNQAEHISAHGKWHAVQ